MKFALSVLSKYLNLFLIILLYVVFFMGNSSMIELWISVSLLILAYLIARTVLPNFRFDQIITIH
jgi:NADH:ubiquinone oxidoreductase subunit H